MHQEQDLVEVVESKSTQLSYFYSISLFRLVHGWWLMALWFVPYIVVQERVTSIKQEIDVLTEGCLFWKVKSTKNWLLRRYWLDMNHLCLRYEPTQKPFWKNCPMHGNNVAKFVPRFISNFCVIIILLLCLSWFNFFSLPNRHAVQGYVAKW